MGWVDLDSWKRAGHFYFFKNYEQPFFNVCADIDVSALYARSKEPGGPSFFLATLYYSTRAANEVEAFRLRLREGRVWRHDVVHAGSTILRSNETFTFADFEFVEDYNEFERRGRAVIEVLRDGTEPLASDEARDDLIYHSVLPWIRFTSFSNAHRSLTRDSVPRIVFGQHFERDGKRWLPISVEVHHALVDGLDVGRFLERFSLFAGD
jgi:chloramphenicol O-acetyltransferase type A